MPNQNFHAVIVTGIASLSELQTAHIAAQALFDQDLVSPLTPEGHNFVASFAVFPSGSGEGREANKTHISAMCVFLRKLNDLGLDFVCVNWGDNRKPHLIAHHDEP